MVQAHRSDLLTARLNKNRAKGIANKRIPLPVIYYQQNEGKTMNLSIELAPLVSLAAGILILAVPKLLNYIVAGYLIVIGLIGIFNLNI